MKITVVMRQPDGRSLANHVISSCIGIKTYDDPNLEVCLKCRFDSEILKIHRHSQLTQETSNLDYGTKDFSGTAYGIIETWAEAATAEMRNRPARQIIKAAQSGKNMRGLFN